MDLDQLWSCLAQGPASLKTNKKLWKLAKLFIDKQATILCVFRLLVTFATQEAHDMSDYFGFPQTRLKEMAVDL